MTNSVAVMAEQKGRFSAYFTEHSNRLSAFNPDGGSLERQLVAVGEKYGIIATKKGAAHLRVDTGEYFNNQNVPFDEADLAIIAKQESNGTYPVTVPITFSFNDNSGADRLVLAEEVVDREIKGLVSSYNEYVAEHGKFKLDDAPSAKFAFGGVAPNEAPSFESAALDISGSRAPSSEQAPSASQDYTNDIG